MFHKLTEIKELLTIADKVVIIAIILLSGLLIFLTPQLVAQDSVNKDVVITLDKEEIYRYNLQDNTTIEKYNFDFKINGAEYQGTLKMKEGKVKLERLSQDISPLPIHAEMGWISEPYQMIVCLPVKLAVTIESNNQEESNIDLRTF